MLTWLERPDADARPEQEPVCDRLLTRAPRFGLGLVLTLILGPAWRRLGGGGRQLEQEDGREHPARESKARASTQVTVRRRGAVDGADLPVTL